MDYLKRTYAKINIDSLKFNAQSYLSVLPSETKLMCVVKANAYGHGVKAVTSCLQDELGVRWFGVSNIDEAIELRENGILGDENDLSKKLENAKKNGFNAIMLDFKDEDGGVLFPCASENYNGKNLISQSVIEQIKGEGFAVLARIYCFCDSYAPQRTGAYVYADDKLTEPWFDAPSALSGKVWLNPADSRAQNYILTVIEEAADFGADCIYLQSVEFPASKENPPVFTENDASLSRNFILLNFIEKAVEKSGKCPVILGFSFEGIEGDGERWGGTLFDSAAAACSPEIPDSENYAKYVGDMWKVLNDRAKNNFSTLNCIPTVKDRPENRQFYSELNENGAQSYIIIP